MSRPLTPAACGLSERGALWRSQFKDIRFLGQIELSRSETEALWADLGREYLAYGLMSLPKEIRENLDCSTAVVLANLAFYSDAADAVEGYVAHFTSGLRWPEAERQALWEDRIGSRVRRVLERYLDYSETENDAGSWRFVRPVLRQAGVPLRLVDKFLDWLRPLSDNPHLTRGQYREHLEAAGAPGTILGWILRGEDGYELCAGLIRGLQEDAGTPIPGIRGELLERARESLRSVPISGRRGISRGSGPEPRIAFDIERLQIGIQLPERPGLEYIFEDSRIFGFLPLSRLPGDGGDTAVLECRGARSEKLIVPLNGVGEPGFWAAFSESGGRFLTGSATSAAIPPGRVILVAARASHAALAGICQERFGEIELPTWAHGPFEAGVFDIIHPSRLEISSRGAALQQAIRATLPTLAVAADSTVVVGNVFRWLPNIRVYGWSKESSGEYRAFCSVTSRESEEPIAQEAHISDDGWVGVDRVPVRTARIRVWLTPIGVAPRGWNQNGAVVEFVVLAAGTRVDWPVRLRGRNEHAAFRFDGPDISSVSFDGVELGPDTDGFRNLPPEAGSLLLEVRTRDGLTFEFVARSPRAVLRAPSVAGFQEWPVLFRADLESDVGVSIELPPANDREMIRIGLLKCGVLTGATALPLRREQRHRGLVNIGGHSLSDAMGAPGIRVGQFGVEVDGRTVSLGAQYAVSARAFLLDEDGASAALESGGVPRGHAPFIATIRSIRDGPVRLASVASPMREPLRQWVDELRFLSEHLDFGNADAVAPAHRPDLAFLQDVGRRRGARDRQTVEYLIASLDFLGEELSWLARWRERVQEITALLRQELDAGCGVAPWMRCLSLAQPAPDELASTTIHRSAGGPALTEGARKLLMAMRAKRPIQHLGGPDGAFAHLIGAVDESIRGGTVFVAATLLLEKAYLFCGNQSKAREARHQLADGMSLLPQSIETELNVVFGQQAQEREAAGTPIGVEPEQPSPDEAPRQAPRTMKASGGE